MYVILNLISVRPENLDQFISGVSEHAVSSAAEPGCVRYDVLQDSVDPAVVCLYEVFVDEAAFRQHLEYDHYKAWMDLSRDWRLDEERVRHVLDYVFRTEDAG